MKEKKTKMRRVKSKVYKKQSDLTTSAVKKVVKRSKRRALTAEQKRRKMALHSAIHNPRIAFRGSGTQMPSDTVVHKKNRAGEVYEDVE